MTPIDPASALRGVAGLTTIFRRRWSSTWARPSAWNLGILTVSERMQPTLPG